MADDAVGLGQLSRLLFDRAAATWQWSIALELCAGAVGIAFALTEHGAQGGLLGAIIVFCLLVIAYWLRYQFEEAHGVAESMRRQSVLSEALGWEIERAQLIEWRNRAGPEILREARQNPRPDDYFDNSLDQGAKKLAEMTFESAFWTRCLYGHMRRYLFIGLIVVVVALVGVMSASAFDVVPSDAKPKLFYAAYLAAPVFLTVDLVGMVLRLDRAISEIKALTAHVERMTKLAAPDIGAIMRLASEYNCIVASGLPIPNWVWQLHRTDITESWTRAGANE